MSDYYDDPEPQEPTLEEMAPKKLTVTVDLNEGVIAAMVVRRAENNVKRAMESYEREYKKQLRDTVDVLVKEQAAGLIEAEVKAILAEGWTKTNQWGEKQETLTLRQRITAVLEEKADRNGYSSSQGETLLTRTIKASVENFLGNEMAKEIEAAKTELKKQLDAVVSKTFLETLKSAMGLAR